MKSDYKTPMSRIAHNYAVVSPLSLSLCDVVLLSLTPGAMSMFFHVHCSGSSVAVARWLLAWRQGRRLHLLDPYPKTANRKLSSSPLEISRSWDSMLNILETLTHHTFFCISPLHKLPLFRELYLPPPKGELSSFSKKIVFHTPCTWGFILKLWGLFRL